MIRWPSTSGIVMPSEFYRLREEMMVHAAGCERCAWWMHVDEGDEVDEWGLCADGRARALELYTQASAASAN